MSGLAAHCGKVACFSPSGQWVDCDVQSILGRFLCPSCDNSPFVDDDCGNKCRFAPYLLSLRLDRDSPAFVCVPHQHRFPHRQHADRPLVCLDRGLFPQRGGVFGERYKGSAITAFDVDQLVAHLFHPFTRAGHFCTKKVGDVVWRGRTVNAQIVSCQFNRRLFRIVLFDGQFRKPV